MARRVRRGSSSPLVMIAGVVLMVGMIMALSSKVFSAINDGGVCGAREEDPAQPGYCSLTSQDFDELVIVTGNTQNSPMPKLDFTTGELNELLTGVFYSSARGDTPRISIISAAGSNRRIEFTVRQRPAQNVRASHNALKKLAKELSEVIITPATEAGADYLGGIIEARNLISAQAKNPLILVVGSGYSDMGTLNFASGEIFERYYEDEENIAALVANDRSLQRVSLDGVSVYWYNLGNVVAPQTNMNKYKEDTKAIYELALEKLGAQNLQLSNYTGVTSDAEAVNSEYSVMQTYVDELKVGDTFNVNENVGQFYPDRADLVDAAKVEERLRSFAHRFNNQSAFKLKLTGYIAYCLESNDLGLARSNTIKDILIKLGVKSEKIITEGRRGSPPEQSGQEYVCDSTLPATERRTVQIEVVQE